jgi:hypothetical protein
LLRQIPIFFFHNPNDPDVEYNNTVNLQNNIDQASALRTIDDNELWWPPPPPRRRHICWTSVYGHPALYNWLLDPLPNPNAWEQMINPLPY